MEDIWKAFAEEDHKGVLNLLYDVKKNEELTVRDREKAYRIAATSAFILAGGWACKDPRMMERARKLALDAGSFAQDDLVPMWCYYYLRALYMQILYALGDRNHALGDAGKAVKLFPKNSDLAISYAILIVQDRRADEAFSAAELAQDIALMAQDSAALALAHWFKGACFEALGGVFKPGAEGEKNEAVKLLKKEAEKISFTEEGEERELAEMRIALAKLWIPIIEEKEN